MKTNIKLKNEAILVYLQAEQRHSVPFQDVVICRPLFVFLPLLLLYCLSFGRRLLEHHMTAHFPGLLQALDVVILVLGA